MWTMKSISQAQQKMRSELREKLRACNLRITGPRLAVLTVLKERKGPMTHQEIMNTLPAETYDKTTVWRICADLAEAGVLHRMDLGDRVWRYELVGGCRPEPAGCAHFLCDDCSKVICFPPVDLQFNEYIPKELLGADLKIRIAGTCSDCVSLRDS
ncbi:MAG: hypothetical protein CMK59_08015 [Proteobacteria bacterium]|nr:hypothetical protein [Pseudomonadota bacterium]